MIQDRNQPISDAPWGRSLSIAIGDFLVAATPQWRCKNHRGWGLCSNWRYSKHLNTFDGLQVTGDLNMIDICSTGFSMMKSYQLKEAMIRRWSDSMAINNKGCSDHWWLISHIYISEHGTLRLSDLNTTVDSMLSMLRSWGIWGFNPQQTVHVAEPHPWTPSHWRTASPNARIPICGKPVVSTTGEIWNAGKHGIIYIFI